MNIEEIRKKFYEGVRKGDPDRMLVWAGIGELAMIMDLGFVLSST